MTVQQFETWLSKSKPGSTTTYHVGYLPNDREADQGVNMVAHAALMASEVEAVLLTQRRLGDFRYSYLATKRSLRRPLHA